MKKNLIFALILSLVAAFNLTSCQQDDDEIANNYLKSEDINSGRLLTNRVISASYDEDADVDESRALTATFVQHYLQENLAGLVQSITVSPDFKTIAIHSKQGKDNELKERMYIMNNNNDELKEIIRDNIPQATQVTFSITYYHLNSLCFYFHYTK